MPADTVGKVRQQYNNIVNNTIENQCADIRIDHHLQGTF
jgi:hypothetical protein